eukprot:3574407-Amphidinium_carterae.1
MDEPLCRRCIRLRIFGCLQQQIYGEVHLSVQVSENTGQVTSDYINDNNHETMKNKRPNLVANGEKGTNPRRPISNCSVSRIQT